MYALAVVTTALLIMLDSMYFCLSIIYASSLSNVTKKLLSNVKTYRVLVECVRDLSQMAANYYVTTTKSYKKIQ
jgi:hypothetical protein